jgi:hypothetical protein
MATDDADRFLHNDTMTATGRRPLRGHAATLLALAVVVACIVLFFQARRESRPIEEVAGRLGLKADDLVAMAPRISSRTGATLGTSRRVVYLMACSGVASGADVEAQAMLAADLAEKQRLTPRQATTTVLRTIPAGQDAEKALLNC